MYFRAGPCFRLIECFHPCTTLIRATVMDGAMAATNGQQRRDDATGGNDAAR